MSYNFFRTELLIGKEGLQILKNAKVVVFGIGGVGSFAVESLVRAGIGNLIIVDFDTISITNINRQILATQNTIGKSKVKIMEERILSINPDINITSLDIKMTPDISNDFFEKYQPDYIVDAIDMITSKLDLIIKADQRKIPIISSMGMGNRLDPTKIIVSDIKKTNTCRLARIIRKELKNRRIKNLKVVFSTEEPLKPKYPPELLEIMDKKRVLGSISFVPSVAGLIISSQVVNDLLNKKLSKI